MKSTIKLVNPPNWWHKHGTKMSVKMITIGRIGFGSKIAELTIRKDPHQEERWVVAWSIIHGVSEGETKGFCIFSTEELLGAFGLNDFVDNDGNSAFREAFRACSASQGKFVRAGRYLNIPCPGTACDGDPNISIFVEENIQDAICFLVEQKIIQRE